MHSPLSRQGFYLRLYDLLHPQACHAHHRAVSTTAAINKGLHASRNDGGGGGGGGGRDRARSPPYDDQPRLTRTGGFRKRVCNEPDPLPPRRMAEMRYRGALEARAAAFTGPRTHATTPAREGAHDDIWSDIRRLGELLEAIQNAEDINPDSRPDVLISEARITIDKVNAEMQLLGSGEERRERVFYLQRRLRGLGVYAKSKLGGEFEADKTVVLEKKNGSEFQLVLRGETVALGRVSRDQQVQPDEQDSHEAYKRLQEGDDAGELGFAPEDEAQVAEKIRRMRTLLDSIKSQNPSAPLPPAALKEVHRLLHEIGVFGIRSQGAWRATLGKQFASILAGAWFLRRRGASEGPGRATYVQFVGRVEHKKLELEFDASGLREGGWKDGDEKDAAAKDVDPDQKPLGPDEAAQVRADVRRIRSLLETIQKIESPSDTNPSIVDPSARGALVKEVRSLVERMNELTERPGKGGVFIHNQFRGTLGGFREIYAKKGYDVDRSRTMIRHREDGLHELIVKGEQPERSVARRTETVKKEISSVEKQRPSSQPPRTEAAPAVRSRQAPDTAASFANSPVSTRPDLSRRLGIIPPKPRSSSDDDSGRDIPLSVPYTTSASEFLYGSNVVLAALRARRRKLYHLYLSPRAYNRETGNAQQIIDLARRAGVAVEADANVRLLDKMSDNRPHNGVVLEASKLPAPPVLSLAKPDMRTSIIPLGLDRQTAEDIAVNGAPAAIPTQTNTWRHPFVVMLDGITDPGNLGNILRTAHFYGADAVAISTNTCAPLSSAVLAKASSGACEAVRLLALPKPSNFVFESAKAGWRVYAAVAPPPPGYQTTAKEVGKQISTTALATNSPLAKHPVLLMLGAEGEGLRANLVSKADHLLSIEGGDQGRGSEGVDVGVDSLNVGVAAGVLMEAFLRKPGGGTVPAVQGSGGGSGDLGF